MNPYEKLKAVNLEDHQLIMKLLKEKGGKDLFKFNKYVLEAEKGDKNFVPLVDCHQEMCRFAQDKRDKKKLILIPRAHLKSKLITIGYSLFRIAEDPKVRILIYSATWQMAVDLLSQIQRNLEGNDLFKQLYGDYSQNAKEWSQDRIRLNVADKREPTVIAAGIENNLVGFHCDVIIFDDVVSRDNIGTADQIQKIIKRYNDSLDLLEPGGQLIVIGTRWHDADLYGWIMEPDNNVKHQYDIFIKEAYTGNIESGENFEALWPAKFTLKELRDRLHSEGWPHFSAQYLNNPVPEESATFKRSWFQYYETPDLKGKLFTKFMTIDPAISQDKYADYTAMDVVGVDEFGYLYILDLIRERLTPNELIQKIFQMKDRWTLSDIAIETVAFQKTLAYTLREEMRRRNNYFHITEVKPQNRTKDERIKGLQPLYENGKIIHNKLLTNNYYLEDELVRYPNATHDDLLDALSYMLDIIYPAKQKVSRKWGDRYLY